MKTISINESGRVKVILTFPTIDKQVVYGFSSTMPTNGVDRDVTQLAMREFFEHYALLWFALYGYAPMNVSVTIDGKDVASYAACYQETLWHEFFAEGGRPWFGRFQCFVFSLIEHRNRMDNNKRKAA